jgi:hypothetical protein
MPGKKLHMAISVPLCVNLIVPRGPIGGEWTMVIAAAFGVIVLTFSAGGLAGYFYNSHQARLRHRRDLQRIWGMKF